MDLKNGNITKIWFNIGSIFCKFAGFGLQLYYQRAPSQVFRKDKGYTLHRSAEQLLFEPILHGCIYLQKEDSCPAKQLHAQGQQCKS